MRISREQVIRRLREAKYSYKSRADRTELHVQRGTGQRINVSLRDYFDEDYVRIVLRQAGLAPDQIDDFFRSAVKTYEKAPRKKK